MRIDDLLQRLQKVRSKGADRWIACCPAHEDNNPSLHIKDAGDRVLLHCFSGCSITAICQALSITERDLFQNANQPLQIVNGVSKRLLSEALKIELIVLTISADDRDRGRELNAYDTAREATALRRVQTARGMI